MLIDSYLDFDFIESNQTAYGLPIYLVIDNKGRKPKIKAFRGESAYHNAERYMNDLINARVYGNK